MKAINYSEFRQNLKSHLDSSCQDHETLVVTRKANENVVVMSQEDYNSLMETVYLLSSNMNANRLSQSIKQSKTKKTKTFDLKELEED